MLNGTTDILGIVSSFVHSKICMNQTNGLGWLKSIFFYVVMMSALSLLEDIANGRIRGEQVFRDHANWPIITDG